MNKSNEMEAEIRALRERLSRLCAAVLRISSSLDLDTVLREVVASARALTGARYGVITTIDKTGQPQNFVTSGITPDEHRQLAAWPDGRRLFEHLRDLPGAIRLRDLPAYVRSLGFSSDLIRSKTLQGTPMRHRGMYVGTFFLAAKESGPEFTDEDEEVLVLFASQAATAIANARTHQDEQQARSNLEALVDTSPVGVVVFDPRIGHPVSLNREAKRIVGGLRMPDRTLEQLLEVLTYRRADGREIALDDFPLALAQELMSNTELVRAEEIVLSVPDGRSVKTLVNATPILSADGAVESLVVTLQDMTPLEDLERMRSEFLGMVSHELRAPLVSIKGCATTVLGASSALDPAETLQFFRIINEQADRMRDLIGDLLDATRIETGTLSVTLEPAEVAVMVDQARNMFLSGGGSNTVHIDLPPDLPLVRADRQRIVQVLVNLLTNAALNSPESSMIQVSAVQEDVHVAVSVTDQGRGISVERQSHLFQKFARSGLEERGRGIGAGLGLAICKGLVEAHGGRIWAESEGTGLGTRFTFTIPLVEEVRTGVMEVPTHRPVRPRRADRQKPLVLVVDDDPLVLGYIRGSLEDAGFSPLVTGNPKDVSDLIETRQPDLVLLDLLLPDTDGIQMMQDIPALADRPVIFLSAYGRDETIARALEVGAVDYIVKPFSPTELVARIQAALRKSNLSSETYQSGDLVINYEERRVTVDGCAVRLTATEYDLLRVLSTNAGRVVTYENLLRSVWRSRSSGDVRPVRAFVKKLRHKLGDDASNPTYIFTEPRVGYRMHRPDDASEAASVYK